MTESKRIDCMKCRYYYVTWDKSFPRGCKFFNFKSAQMPAIVVRQSSGTPCLKFEPKG
ncbi:uracil-DNA glycosylase [Paenibacillus contaminans]|uniref:Uracil-DNA glycosylase n=1 Tax=Paenibacillus contaminans TaxID=450362 RepID=A0A329MGK8_9BACL|nr:uracil-DNA glycosylase [Paenibacillus contaminans]RAV18940.1 uracil-DNA glycosylase [Paenibacillus contaminans]